MFTFCLVPQMQLITMRLFSQINRCAELTNFYRKLVSDSRLSSSKAITLRVIGCGALGESPSVCLSTKDETYLFNCGEDCYRLIKEQQIKSAHIQHIFVTQVKWNCIGGISCFSKEINKKGFLPLFHGPKQLYKSIKRILCLSILSELNFRPIDCNLKKFYENNILRIDFIPIGGAQSTTKTSSQHSPIHEVLAFVGHLKSQLHANSGESNTRRNETSGRFMSKIDNLAFEQLKINTRYFF